MGMLLAKVTAGGNHVDIDGAGGDGLVEKAEAGVAGWGGDLLIGKHGDGIAGGSAGKVGEEDGVLMAGEQGIAGGGERVAGGGVGDLDGGVR